MADPIGKTGSGSLSRSGRRKKLLLAAFLGVMSAALAFVYLQGSASSSAPASSVSETTLVVTATREIPAQARIEPEMVELKHLPADAVVPGAIHSAEEVVDTVARYPIGAGEQLTPMKVSSGERSAGLAAAIPPGYRAMAISTSAVVTAGGMLEPGDRVDVLAVVEQSADDTSSTERVGEATSRVLVEDTEVLAVAQRLGEVAPPPVAPDAEGQPGSAGGAAAANAEATTVTLALTTEEAQRVLLYEQQGLIRLIVRPATPPTAGAQ